MKWKRYLLSTMIFNSTDISDVTKVMYEDLEVADLIGRGSSSVVLRARHIVTDRLVALKVKERWRTSLRLGSVRQPKLVL